MDTTGHFRHPAKRPRLGEAPEGSNLRQLCLQSSQFIQSAQSTDYLISPLTQHTIIDPASHAVPMTGQSDSFDPRFSEFGGQWMVNSLQPSFGAERLPPRPGCYPNQRISTLHHQNYAGQLPFTFSERSNVLIQPQSPMFPPPGLPHVIGHFPWTASASPCPEYVVPASLPNLGPIQHSLDTMDRNKSELELRMTDESGYPIVEYSQLDVPEESEDIETETVCFGMIPNIAASYERQSSSDIPSTFSVQIESSNRFIRAQDGIKIDGRIPTEYGEMIQGLIDEPTVTLHVSCVTDDKSTAKKPSRKFELLPCVLEITVYGSVEIFEEIGIWFQGHEIYLQDPRSCHMEVKYYNPQRLSAHDLDTCPLLSEIVLHGSVLDLQSITQRPDPLDILSSHVDLEEAPQPSVIRTALKKHQKQALTFMLHREEGWGFNNGQPDIWEKVDTGSGRTFINTISDAYRAEEPPQFYGGIIADPMGLGKTLTMIALVATDLDTDIAAVTPEDSIDPEKCYTSATLVIMPPPLLGSWEEQLSDHVADGDLKCRRHHGQTKLANPNELDRVNIVLTTYHTVSAEWRSDKLAGSSILFQVRWRRIILDEAHFIRNGNSRMARAICDLDSMARWAVTGTPIQNRLGDLVSLLKFIRVHPYDDPERFDADISQVWKSGNDQDAIQRLQRLSACLMLRRAKGTINLPPRRDCLLPVQLTHEERAVYNELREQTISKIDEALHKDSGTSRDRGYARPEPTFTSLPSKVEALIKDLQTVPSDVKCIVFSTWRLSLDLIERGLDQASLRSIRFDGKVPQKDRQAIIDKFRADPSIRIMLLTLACGAVGLTLTAASRAYLMEPHWNPTLEEQALARIYRLGQTRDVTTVRLYVKESFEEQVMQLQESKKNLASVLLSPHDGGQTDKSLRALET
ncbi:hypothetical protein EG329_012923 [Mollisiaceae sp. DMI_Dod_QoI]|nr:hypothetical protein EG329_012923 [Helotiales sp. DMI_Dod_QoI]